MDLTWQNDIINGLIKEYPESTIKDYLELLKEIEAIKNSNAMPNHRIGEDKRRQILMLAAAMTAKEIREKTNLSFFTIYKVLNEENFDFRELSKERRLSVSLEKREAARIRKELEEADRLARLRARGAHIAQSEPAHITRPTAEYSNSSPWGISTENRKL